MLYAKTFTSLLLLTFTSVFHLLSQYRPASAQTPVSHWARQETRLRADEKPTPASRQLATPASPLATAPRGTISIPYTRLGTASNLFSWTKPEQHLLSCDPATGLLVHVHRQDVTIWGGGTSANGKFRYDISADGGATFHLDVGPLNTAYTAPARYPQLLSFSPDSSSSPLAQKLVWAGATLDGASEWEGVVAGVADATLIGTPGSTENYLFAGDPTLIPGSLSPGLPGEFWMADLEYITGAMTGKVLLLKGTYNSSSQDVNWVIYDTLSPDYNLSFGGSPFHTTPNIHFSPDGQHGWLSLLGDLNGGKDSTFNPLFWHTTDGGATWDSGQEVNLDMFGWIKDTLQTLWVDSSLAPASSGIATCAFDHDITVDQNGNVHMGVVIGSRPKDPAYSYQFSSDLAKFMADVYTTDGGVSWSVKYLAPVLTFRVLIGSGSPPLTLDNHPQAARNADGSKVFFTWIDTDTCDGLFGSSDNVLPDLRGVSWRVTDGHRTMYKLFTDKDLLFGGTIIFPSMAPVTLRRPTADHMFTGFPRMLATNDELQPCEYITLIDQTWFDDSEYLPDAAFPDLSWNCGLLTQLQANAHTTSALHIPYPNPTSDRTVISFEVGLPGPVNLSLTDLQGRPLKTILQADLASGSQQVDIDVTALPTGIYLCILQQQTGVLVQKLLVAR